MNQETKKTKWHRIIADQVASGQTQAPWCRDHDINIHTFRYWKNRLGMTQPVESNPVMGFVAVKPAMNTPGTMRITVGAATIEVMDSVNLSMLEGVIQVLMRHA